MIMEPRPVETLAKVRPLEKPLTLRYWRDTVNKVAVLWITALGVGEVLLLHELLSEGLSISSICRFILPNLLVLPPAIRQFNRYLRKQETRYEFGERGIKKWIEGELVLEIPYLEIDTLTANPAENGPYLQIAYAGGDEKILRKSSGCVPDGDIADHVVQIVGPRLLKDAKLYRKDRPLGAIPAFLWDHFGDPPEVRLIEGQRYGYRVGSFDQDFRIERPLRLEVLTFLLLMYAMMSTLPKMAMLSMFAVFAYQMACNQLDQRETKSMMGDQFELVEGGLRVYRGGEHFDVAGPVPDTWFNKAKHAGQRIRVYRRGRTWYFFDPRFIEPIS